MPSKSKKPSTVQASRQTRSNISSKPTNFTTQPTAENGSLSSELVNGRLPSPQADLDSRTGDTTESAGEPNNAPATNRKKQKRREKEAAKRLAEEQLINERSGMTGQQLEQITAVKQGRGPAKGYFTEETDYIDDGFHDSLAEPDDAFFSGDENGNYAHDYVDNDGSSWLNTSRRKKSSRSKHGLPHPGQPTSVNSAGIPRTTLPTLSNAAIRSAHKMSNDQIWNTSTQAERENIKQFWLELGEEERRSLVKVEKEAVLRKMKEQQKHSCSCSVCGRKRTAIEEELEVLYDAYYEELEQFANHTNEISDSPQPMQSHQSYRSYKGRSHPMAGSYPISGRVRELGENGEELDNEDEYDDEDEEDDEEPYSDEDYDDDLPPGPPDFFQFGNSLTVKDGILTVADDLLKNDGKHFIDMMEQLAERRMQREEAIHYPAPPLAHQGMRQGHNHPPIDEDDDYDDEEDDEEEYDSQDEEDFEGDEMDSMTEEQRMEEGRRMFQIFAARMFEQRVLTAYREKVAAERQQKLLEELDEESRLDTQREAKKAKDAAKKKEKKARQKAVKEEEKAKKEAEKAAQEAAVKAAEEKKAEEQKRRKEEQRKKRDAERKAAEDEKQRKEAEKQKRAQEERDRQAENDRRQREAKEREKKKREEARKKDREEREAKEKDLRDKRLKGEKEKKAQEDHARRQREETLRAERDAKSKHDSTTKTQPIVLPPGLQPTPRGHQVQSPLSQVAAPVVPQAVPAPVRNRQPSQPSQPSHTSSPRSQQASTEASQTSVSPISAVQQTNPPFNQSGKVHGQGPQLYHPQPAAPKSPLNNVGRGSQYPYPVNGMQGLGMNGPPQGPGMVPGIGPPMSMYPGPPPPGPQQRFAPNGVNYPPGFGGPRPYQPVQPINYHQQNPIVGMAQPPPPQPVIPLSHSRQPSGTETNHQGPISRPGPIARPSSTTPDVQRHSDQHPDADVDQLTTQLGSKALLDDSDEPILSKPDPRMSHAPVGPPGSGRVPFASQFNDPKQTNFGMTSPGWNTFGSGMPGGGWPTPTSRPSPGWPQQPFGTIGPMPPAGGKGDGFFHISAVLQQLEQQKMHGDPPVTMDELLAICDTEGNVQNGGGSFEVIRDGNGHQLIKYVDDHLTAPNRAAAGDIGSPMPMQSPAAPFGSIGQGFGPPGRHF